MRSEKAQGGSFTMGSVRLKDIAEECGVSIATVSRALNGLRRDDSKTAAAIRRAAREMGYVPNAAALALKTNRSNTIGVLYEDKLDHEYFSALLDDLRREAGMMGCRLTLIGGPDPAQTGYIEQARCLNLDGVIIIQADFESSEVARLVAGSLPTVIIDHLYEGSICVGNDNQESMRQIVRYVWQRGHRRIGYITGEDGGVTRERLSGFYRACAELGICVPEGSVREGHFRAPDECAALIRSLMADPVGATCILCPDDYSCLGAMWALKEEGISVPEQVSLVGYDGIRMGQMIRPRLTTYRQDTAGIAVECMRLLSGAIESPDKWYARRAIVSGNLVEGETVLRLPR